MGASCSTRCVAADPSTWCRYPEQGFAEYGEQQLGEKGVLDCRAQGRGRCAYGDGEHALEAPVSRLDTGETAGAFWRRSCRDARFDQGPVGRTAIYPLKARPEASGAPSAFGGLPPGTTAIRLTGGPSLFACFRTSLHHEGLAGRPNALERTRGGRLLCLVALSCGERGWAPAVLLLERRPLRPGMKGEAGWWAASMDWRQKSLGSCLEARDDRGPA